MSGSRAVDLLAGHRPSEDTLFMSRMLLMELAGVPVGVVQHDLS